MTVSSKFLLFCFKQRASCKQLFKKLIVMNKTKRDCVKTAIESGADSVKKPMTQTSNGQFDILATPIKSQSDKKDYRVIRLKNGLTACLVSDSSPITEDEELEEDESESGSESNDSSDDHDTDEDSDSDDEDDDDEGPRSQKMAAASLCVNVGSFSDPKSVPGMAHFLEHMVFMGSEKYPAENDFDAFLSKRGGSDNASTDCEHTTFYFECLERDLFEALDKFSQFFIAPLMKRGSITREREAIESEFQMAVPSDISRKEHFISSLAASECPANSFAWGNLITLRDNVAEDDLYKGVHEFRKRHYSAHRMTLAIQARLPLDELETCVINCFSNVPSNNLPPDDFTGYTNVFDTPAFKKIYYIEPVKDIIQVNLTWALPSLLDQYKCKPHQYISWILGDEGKGSLLSYLKNKVWVLGLTAGNDESGSEHNSMYALFTISLTLTKEGFDHLGNIIEAVFAYITLLKTSGIDERIFNEMKLIHDNAFKFASEESATDYTETLSESMQFYPPEHYLTGSELFYEYNPTAIKEILDNLIPENVNIQVFSKNIPTDLKFNKTEKWFGIKYAEKDIPAKWLEKWGEVKPFKEFNIPPPNVFLTDNFNILEEDDHHPDYPEKVCCSDLVELWYRKDQKFKLPIAYYHFYLINPDIVDFSKTAALMQLFITALQISLAEDSYAAQAAHLEYSLSKYDKGLLISVYGYNQKLHLLIELIGQHFTKFPQRLSLEMFTAIKDKILQFYYNRLISPNKLATDLRLDILVDKHHSLIEKYNSTLKISYNDVIKFSEDFMKKLFFKVLVQGNVEKRQAIDVTNDFIKAINCTPMDGAQYPNIRVSQIPHGETFCIVNSLNLNDANSIITNYYQSELSSLKDKAIIDLLMVIIEEPLFDTLRTKEQLGYDVSCSDRDTFGILGFSITVNAQATKNSADYVNSRIDLFVKNAVNILKETDDETFQSTKQDLIKTKKCDDVHLKEEVDRNWYEIIDDDYIFDRIKQEIEIIEKLTLEEIQEWWENHTNSNLNCRKLSVQVCGYENAEQKSKTSENTQLNTEMKLEFITDDSKNNVKFGNEIKSYVEDVQGFKKKIYLYPCKNTYTITTSSS